MGPLGPGELSPSPLVLRTWSRPSPAHAVIWQPCSWAQPRHCCLSCSGSAGIREPGEACAAAVGAGHSGIHHLPPKRSFSGSVCGCRVPSRCWMGHLTAPQSPQAPADSPAPVFWVASAPRCWRLVPSLAVCHVLCACWHPLFGLFTFGQGLLSRHLALPFSGGACEAAWPLCPHGQRLPAPEPLPAWHLPSRTSQNTSPLLSYSGWSVSWWVLGHFL